LTEDEIKKMVRDAEANIEADKKFAEVAQARNTAEGLVHATRKTLQEAGDKVTSDEKANIEAAIKEVEEVVKGEDKAAIEAATHKLTEASSGMAQKMYAEAQANAQQQQPQQGGEQASNKDDVVDAEFEEVKDDK
jgi:molecular chaperone DnaK